MTTKHKRLEQEAWQKWGPYLSDRQWGTVREDYSAGGDPWNYTTHDMARSKAYRWGEEGIGGISDASQLLCLALAFWNGHDPILKERYFGLTNPQGNHGEDVKELYYYIDNTPTHAYMKLLYKYPHGAFPYQELVAENGKRTRLQPEFELLDTGVFSNDAYFDVFIEYAKKDAETIFIKVTIYNRGSEAAPLHVLPSIWFRNTWAWGYDQYKPQLRSDDETVIEAYHHEVGQYWLLAQGKTKTLFCENETNTKRLYNDASKGSYFKDGINDHVVDGAATVNPAKEGTKAAFHYDLVIPVNEPIVLKLCLTHNPINAFDDFDTVFKKRMAEADSFYKNVLKQEADADLFAVKRQALAGLLWNKQFYYYNVYQWLKGDPAQPPPPARRLQGRNADWKCVDTFEILSMPDKWEYPWFAAWDTAFHCFPLAQVDIEFAKQQLLLLTKEWYMHPNGQLPAYEWNFSDSNPPIHAMASWALYQREKKEKGKGDLVFLEKVFHKLMLNFTWWVNGKDAQGDNIFEGGFLGLDNIGVFDRSAKLPTGEYIEQSDATSWMAVYSLNLLQIAQELTLYNEAYADIAAKFFEHFLYIAGAMNGLNERGESLWDEADAFYYDKLRLSDGTYIPLKVRTLVGLIPLFVVEVIDDAKMERGDVFQKRMQWFRENRPDLANMVSHWERKNEKGMHLMSLLRGYRMKATLKRLLDESEFLSDYGVRSLSKYHQEHPFECTINGQMYRVQYTPGESDSGLFGGNSNWRGPIWMPLNCLIIEGLRRFYNYYGDAFKVECPTGSGVYMHLNEVADELSGRLQKIFRRNDTGIRPVNGTNAKMQHDAFFKDYILFYEYFHGDTGQGLGAAHQTGWTALIASDLLNADAKGMNKE